MKKNFNGAHPAWADAGRIPLRGRAKLCEIFLIVICLSFSIFLSACSVPEKAAPVEIGLILVEESWMDVNDGTFTQSSYEGIERYAKKANIPYKTYAPKSRTEDGYLGAIKTAVGEGAKILVTPGFNFETPVYTAQDMYPEVCFVLIDGSPNNGKYDETRVEKTAPNTCSLLFAEEQAGFLAGYAIVKDGFRNLGFFGGSPYPAVVNFGYGFVQGAEYAAKELDLQKGSVTIRYGYSGNFEPTPENQAKAASWYDSGTEVIFACGGGMGYSVMQAAKNAGDKWVIGVDTDQSKDSETVITSALKMIANAVEEAIKASYDGTFPGGQLLHLGADSNGIGLEMANAKFTRFTRDDYDKIYAMLAENRDGLTSSIIKNTNLTASELPCEYVKVLE
jgi:basic membrane protein A